MFGVDGLNGLERLSIPSMIESCASSTLTEVTTFVSLLYHLSSKSDQEPSGEASSASGLVVTGL